MVEKESIIFYYEMKERMPKVECTPLELDQGISYS